MTILFVQENRVRDGIRSFHVIKINPIMELTTFAIPHCVIEGHVDTCIHVAEMLNDL